MSNEANCDLNSFLENCAFWAVWQEWGNCSEECDIGSRNRKRGCSGIGECQGDSSESENCNTDPCAYWEQWQSWTACSASCGDGLRKRKRNCLGVGECEGSISDLEACDMGACSIQGWVLRLVYNKLSYV
ncbi:unnamed protein product [Oikopleura dioica]|uniref:Uncharacterized protein n=1 Tax=Oikopleura dioica TaxID=34765 RepID=E4XXN1_OIKDI|nr:unnamed protein product [Oikopleura dioica]